MKRLLIALTLACVLSGTALAGEMPTVGSSVVGENADYRRNVNRRDSNPASTRRNARRWLCDF